MKETIDDLKLLDAALADESWESCSARLRNAGLVTLRAKRRMRARCVIGGQILATLVVVAGVWYSFHATPIADGNRASEFRGQEVVKTASLRDERVEVIAAQTCDRETWRGEETYITEEQMLAMFPEGSCVLAEINGEKQLVLFEDLESGKTKPVSKTSNSSLQLPGGS